MTWNEIRKLHPWLPKSAEGWHQHENGGGWVSDKAEVAADAYVGEHGLVCGGTIKGGTIKGGTIKGGTIEGGTIEGGTIKGGTIWGGTIWGGTICGGTIEGGTIEGGTIKGGTICGGTIVCGTIKGGTIKGGTIWGGTIWGGTIEGGTIEGGTIKGGTIDRSPLLIFGSHYWVGFSRPGYIASGCIEQSIEWWLEHVERCAEEHGYSEDEQQEYRLHVEHVAAWMRLYGLAEEQEDAEETETHA